MDKMTEEQLSNLVVASLTAITTLASQYGLKKITHKKNNLELQKQQQEHTDNLYSKVIELQKDSIVYIEEATSKLKAAQDENDELRSIINKLEDDIIKLKSSER